MAIVKLLDIRDRLSKLLETSSGGTHGHPVGDELTGIIKTLDSAIAELRCHPPANTEQELLRTTSKPLEPPKQQGPHHIDWLKGPQM